MPITDVRSLLGIIRGEKPDNLPMAIEQTQRISRTRLVPKLLRFAGKIPFANDIAAAWFCARDPQTDMHVKAVLFAAVAYFVIPADLIPDFVAGIGFGDDATVIATAFSVVGSNVKPAHRRAARRLLRLPEPETAYSEGETTNSL